MDVRTVATYAKLKRLSENNPEQNEAASARQKMRAMEQEHPKIRQACDLLTRIEQDQYDPPTRETQAKGSFFENLINNPLATLAAASFSAELGKGLGLFLEKAQPIPPKKRYDVARIEDDTNHTYLVRFDPDATPRQVERGLKTLAEMLEEDFEEDDEEEDD